CIHAGYHLARGLRKAQEENNKHEYQTLAEGSHCTRGRQICQQLRHGDGLRSLERDREQPARGAARGERILVFSEQLTGEALEVRFERRSGLFAMGARQAIIAEAFYILTI